MDKLTQLFNKKRNRYYSLKDREQEYLKKGRIEIAKAFNRASLNAMDDVLILEKKLSDKQKQDFNNEIGVDYF